MSSSNPRASSAASRRTRVVMLGTGTPRPDPDRCGPATAIVVDGTPYLIDFGAGVIRRATAAYERGVTEFGPGAAGITTAFLTHLHSDHTIGYPDLIFTPWLMGRTAPLAVYGPRGLKAMTDNIFKAWDVDLRLRTSGAHARGACTVNTHEIAPGIVYRDHNVAVTAFPVHHGTMENSFGFRFETADRTIVVSGDTSPTQSLIDHCDNCDVLIHEAYSLASLENASPTWREFRRTHHTSSRELADIANTVKPGLLVLYHRSNAGGAMLSPDSEDDLVAEIRQGYGGDVVAAHDLDVF